MWAETQTALSLIFSGDRELWAIVALSLGAALAATALAALPALPVAYLIASKRFFGRRALVAVLQSLLSFPTVVVGLILYFLLSRQGPLGAWDLLFTPSAIVIGQFAIACPVVAALSLAALQKNDARVSETARTLGAGSLATAWTEIREVRFGIVAALLAAFGRVISEVGCALMVGGNIAGFTRTMPTAIALETSKGAFSQGIALGIVLLATALAANVLLSVAQGRGR